VAAADAAQFLKRSGLADLVLGKVSKDLKTAQNQHLPLGFCYSQ